MTIIEIVDIAEQPARVQAVAWEQDLSIAQCSFAGDTTSEETRLLASVVR